MNDFRFGSRGASLALIRAAGYEALLHRRTAVARGGNNHGTTRSAHGQGAASEGPALASDQGGRMGLRLRPTRDGPENRTPGRWRDQGRDAAAMRKPHGCAGAGRLFAGKG